MIKASIIDNFIIVRVYSYERSMSILANFLNDDVGYRDIDSIVSWIEDDKYQVTILNYSYIRKQKNNKIHIYFLYDGYQLEEHEKREKFETTKEELIDILTQWESLLNKDKVDIIVIKKENNRITVKKG